MAVENVFLICRTKPDAVNDKCVTVGWVVIEWVVDGTKWQGPGTVRYEPEPDTVHLAPCMQSVA